MIKNLYIPKYKIAFDYKGIQHFNPSPTAQAEKEIIIIEKRKRKGCEKEGITLLEIPYWWDFSISSLAGTVSYYFIQKNNLFL